MSATSLPIVLQVQGVRVEIAPAGWPSFTPVDGVSFSVAAGECLGLVGETGCGKSLTLRAMIGLLPAEARVAEGQLLFQHSDAVEPTAFRPEDVRGHGIAMVFQEPMSALDPSKRVVDLIAEGPRIHEGLDKSAARVRAVQLMRQVGIPDPERRAGAWPWELSGGLRQRVMIAMALSCQPRVLLCDEPTTALDVTIQDQILRLLDRLRRELGLAIVFVTHDLPVVAQIAHRVAVMYAGKIVEIGPVDEVFTAPRHPYTSALLRSAPVVDKPIGRFTTIPGSPPDPRAFPKGCRFSPRCSLAESGCDAHSMDLVITAPAHSTACWKWTELAEDPE